MIVHNYNFYTEMSREPDICTKQVQEGQGCAFREEDYLPTVGGACLLRGNDK